MDFQGTVHIAEDGEVALKLLKVQGVETPFYPALVLLDLNLPKVDGREVLREIKADENLKIVPVIVLSTSALESDVQAAYRLGANCYIQKPSRYGQLVVTLDRILKFWLQCSAHRKVPRLQ